MPLTKKKIFVFAVFILTAFIFIPPVFSDDPAEPASLREKKAREGYVLDLKQLIDQSKKKIELVNDKLQEQAKTRRNEQREEKAREYYEKAMRLFEEDKLAEAQAYWNKAVKITEHPEMKDYISQSVHRTNKQEDALRKEEDKRLKRLEIERGYSASEVENAYQAAVSLFKQKKYVEAKNEFEHVDEMFPDHKATRSYMMLVDQEIQKDQQQIIEAKLKEQAIAKRKEKEEWQKQVEERERESQASLNKQAEDVYQQAVKLYNTQQFREAKKVFQKVAVILPEYKNTANYLGRVDRDIIVEDNRQAAEKQKIVEQQRQQEELARKQQEERSVKQKEDEERERVKRLNEEADFVYQAALGLYKNKDYEKAKEKFTEVEKILPNYKSVPQYLARVDDDAKQEKLRQKEAQQKEFSKGLREEKLAEQQRLENERREAEAKRKAQEAQTAKEHETLYQEALGLYKQKAYTQAKNKLIELQAVDPQHKSTVQYLSRIDGDIQREKELAEKEKLANEQREAQEQRKTAEAKVSAEREELYQDAIDLYRDKAYSQAKNKFTDLQALAPNYKSTAQYLIKIDQEAKKAQGLIEKQLLDNERREAREKEPQRQKQLAQSLDPFYKDAVNLFKQKKFEEAKLKFEELQAKEPNYRATNDYLSRIPLALQKQQEDNERQKIEAMAKEGGHQAAMQNEAAYQEAVSLYKQKLFGQAKAKFLELQTISSNYKSTAQYLTRIDDAIKRQELAQQKQAAPLPATKKIVRKGKGARVKKGEETIEVEQEEDDVVLKAQEEHKKRLAEEVEAKYKEALNFYKANNFVEAKRKFIQVEVIYPDYKATMDYLSRIDEDIDGQGENQSKPKKDSVAGPSSRKKNEIIVKTKAAQKFGEEAEEIYQQAASLYKARQFQAAREKFLQTNQLVAGYKSTKSYLNRIDQDIKRQQKTLQMTENQEVREERISALKPKLMPVESSPPSSDPPRAAVSSEDNFVMAKAKEEQVELLKTRQAKDYRQAIAQEHLALEQAQRDRKSNEAKMRKESRRRVMQVEAARKQEEAQKAKHQKKMELKKNEEPALKNPPVEKPLEAEVKKSKEEIKQKREEERQAKLREAQELKKLKTDIDNVYKESLDLYKTKQIDLSKEKFIKLENLLTDKRLPQDYVREIRERAVRDRERMEKESQGSEVVAAQKEKKDKVGAQENAEKMKAKEAPLAKAKEEKIAQQKAEEINREQKLMEERKRKDLEALQNKIKMEEEKLVRDKQLEELRLKKGREKKEALARLENLRNQKKSGRLEKITEKALLSQEGLQESKDKDRDLQTMVEKNQKAMSEKDKREELEKLVRGRQKELREEREEIRKQFEENIAELYSKAEERFKSGDAPLARKIFDEIEQMKPGYRGAKDYLKKIDEGKGEKSFDPVPAKTSLKAKKRALALKESLKEAQAQDLDSSKDSQSPVEPGVVPTRADAVRQALDALEQGR